MSEWPKSDAAIGNRILPETQFTPALAKVRDPTNKERIRPIQNLLGGRLIAEELPSPPFTCAAMTMHKRLIVNADGFGFGPGATEGILDAIKYGRFISSVSVNANFPEAARVRDLIEQFPQISVGVHLNPMVGKPCLLPRLVPSLVGPDGLFHGAEFPRLLRKGLISLQEMEAEFNAQITRVKELAKNRFTHIDSQGNEHLNYFDLFLVLARNWGLRRMRNNASLICLESSQPRLSRLNVYLRKPHIWLMHRYRNHQMRRARAAGMRMADKLVTIGYAGAGNKTSRDNWLRVLQGLPAGTYEIYCHPAYPDDTLRRWSYYNADRKQELEILRQEELREAAARAKVEIISFDAI